MTRPYEVTPHARADIVGILITSYDKFGWRIRDGYEELIATAIDAIVEDPSQAGVQERPDLGRGICAWHLRLSRDSVPEDVRRIITPRHIVFFREAGDDVQILRVLHEAMNLIEQRYL
ncbi:type II toxin-antitoxin system RelE/ParE family toxin [Microbacterium ulmi]|uniref:Type II toxin-antitoxin system RelE/ParE family toxin n=1 Tax=Microbacterium ulmi TaxID=179095 RepID=A0A7Y2M3H5_9MICO|nr:toxin ParE1/3/4 [Microbacterium ulmi]NNH05079.1 type II toxin-antitoxin system RelE/ParE family toxin [Microbacterium ulmi]